MNLAYVELRLVLARLLWNFELVLDESCTSWAEDLVEYFGWEKTSLQVYLDAKKRGRTPGCAPQS